MTVAMSGNLSDGVIRGIKLHGLGV